MQPASLALVLLITFVTGCGGPWQQFYQPVLGNRAIAFPATESVQIRQVEIERVQNYILAEKQRLAASSKAPEDFTKSERFAFKNRYFEMLRLPERDDSAALLGYSTFVTTQQLNLQDGRLETFAKQLGADYAVVTSAYLGQNSRLVSVPVTSYSVSSSTATLYGSGGGVATADLDTVGASTSWVPTTVTQNQFYYECAFLRKMRPGEAESLLRAAGRRE